MLFKNKMKQIFSIALLCITSLVWGQDAADKTQEQALKKANGLVYEANEMLGQDDYVSAEMEYRKAISEQPNHTVGAYNLGTSYYKKGSLDEALYRLEQAVKGATTKEEKHKAYHNIGNILYKNKRCQEAVEAYKNALRNNPADHETRYNFALAKVCAEQQKQENDQNQENQDQENQDESQEQKEENKDNEESQDDQNKDNEDQGDQDEKEGEDEKDEDGQPKDDNQDQKNDQEKNQDNTQQQQPKPKQGQLSPQQVKNLLEAMNNQEQKVQEKMNAEKQKGIKVQTDKDW